MTTPPESGLSRIPAEIQDAVSDCIQQIEQEYAETHGTTINVVLAVARGSHAWNLDSPNSDYDVGVVYAPWNPRHYAHLGSRPESLTTTYNGSQEIEAQGWDVTKFAELLAESNEQAINMLRSDLVYLDRFGRESLTEYILASFNPMELYHTYRAIAKNNYRKYLSYHLVRGNEIFRVQDESESEYVIQTRFGDERRVPKDSEEYSETQVQQTVKRNLMVGKASLYAHWIRYTGRQGDIVLPDLDFESFLETQAPAIVEDEFRQKMQWLVSMKKSGQGEKQVGDRIGQEYAHQPSYLDPDVYARPGPQTDRLNTAIDRMIDSQSTC